MFTTQHWRRLNEEYRTRYTLPRVEASPLGTPFQRSMKRELIDCTVLLLCLSPKPAKPKA